MAEVGHGGTLQPVYCHTVNRRYSEFLNLQTRLEEKPEVKRVIKSKKWSFAFTDVSALVYPPYHCNSVLNFRYQRPKENVP